MNAPPQTWLILAHSFNMDGRASSQTMTDKIPHLIAHGIRPVVVSAATGHQDTAIEHHQVWSWWPSALRFDLRHVLRLHVRSPYLRFVIKGVLQIVLLPLFFVEKILIPLDSQWSWFLAADRFGTRYIRRHRPQLIYSAAGPPAAHLAAFRLARRFGLPWMAEIYDPMVLKDDPQSWPRRRWKAWIESLICRHADIAIWFTPGALARARERHPQLGARGHLMYPGANPPDHAKRPYQKGSRFVLAHFGSFAATRNLAVVFEALRGLLSTQPAFRSVFRLRTYGGGWDRVSLAALQNFPYPEVVERLGRLEQDPVTGQSGRGRVREAMETTDCLLLLHGIEAPCPEYFPSKLYEYLWTQRPILGLVHHNPDLEAMLRHAGHRAVAAEDADAVRQALLDLLEQWRQDKLQDNGRASPYSTARAVQQMVDWVAALPARPPAPGLS
ncbi:MAG: hypothetical protein L0Y32_05475 [Nevskiales bacterium]|nr:hypothetical protein [Nevskiales bacterium]